MPCKDVTDIIEIVLDFENRLKSYSLHKKTCGRDVKSDISIESWLKGRTADEIADTSLEGFLESAEIEDSALEYLYVKHFLAAKSSLSVMLGKSSGTVDDYCTIVKIDYSPEETVFRAYLSGKGLKKAFKSCSAY